MRRVGRVSVAAVAALAVAAGSAGLATGGARDAVTSVAAPKLSPRLLAGLRVIAGLEGRKVPKGLRAAISAGDVSGLILFSDNVGGRKQVRGLTRELQSIPRPAAVDEPLLIMADQEGGLVRRLPGPPKPSAEVVGRRSRAAARKLGVAAGKSMRGMGVNVNLAPVLDVPRRGGFIEEQHRGYSRKAGRVGRIGSAFAAGMEARGVAATAKHFPGLGAARETTDEQPVKLGLSRSTIRRVDEAPYGPFISAGGSLVMLSLAKYPALGGGPAALSRAIASRELRGRLGFAGVSISDALGAPAATAVGGTGKVAKRCAGAGTDLLLYSDLGSALRGGRAVRKAIAAGSLSRGRAEKSAARIVALRNGLRKNA
jgi:beta-N-acetylhexosaminidase